MGVRGIFGPGSTTAGIVAFCARARRGRRRECDGRRRCDRQHRAGRSPGLCTDDQPHRSRRCIRGACRARALNARRPHSDRRLHRTARLRQEHIDRPGHRRAVAATANAWVCLRSILPASPPAVLCSATACVWAGTMPIRACSSAARLRAAVSAGWPLRPATPWSCWTRWDSIAS